MPGIAVPRCRSASPTSVGRHLVVAAAAGAQLAAERADPLEQAALQGRVHVLVVGRRPEAAVVHRRAERVEGTQQVVELAVGEQAGAVQDTGVRPGGREVVRREAPVEVHAHRQPGQGLARPAGEPAAPQPGR
jgi:hypothetical protein